MTNSDKSTIKEIRSLTGLNENQVSAVFKALAYVIGIGNYQNNESITIPYFGNFKLNYDGDEIIDGDRKAKVSGFFSLHETLKKNVGIIEDYRETGDDNLILDLDSYKNIRNDTRQALKMIDQ